MKRAKNRIIHFKDFPEFQPNLTPTEMFELGSFGGTYWRPIYSSIVNKDFKNQHKTKKDNVYKLFKNIPDDKLTLEKYNTKINKYGIKVGQSLEEWEKERKGGPWIRQSDPYGWVQWYCHFYKGRRLNNGEDRRQIDRWVGFSSETGRFRRWLITLILKGNAKWDDISISPAIRQSLQHWAYKLTEADFKKDVLRREKQDKE